MDSKSDALPSRANEGIRLHPALEFTATTVSCCTQDEVLLIAFGDDDTCPENFCILSRFDDGDEFPQPPDEAVGIQTSMGEAESSAAIATIVLARDRIHIRIAEGRIAQVGTAQLIIHIDAAKVDVAQLASYLHQMFDGCQAELIII